MRRHIGVALALLAAASLSTVAADDSKFKLKPGARGKACLTCHAEFADTVKQPFVHTPVKNGDCADCHDPHASDHGKLLAENPSRICATCHADVVPDKARSVHHDVLAGNCVKCHDPHASANKGNLLKAGNELCLSCHKDLGKAITDAKFKHSPVTKSCLSCHDPHAGEKTDFLLARSVPESCLTCHKPDQPAFQKAHLGYPVAKANCASCHDPHGSSQPAILWASVHQPVKGKMCAQCHFEPGSADALKTKRTGIDGCRGCHSETVNAAFGMLRVHWPVVDRNACLNCHTPHASKTAKLLMDDEKDVCGSCHQDAIARQERSAVKHQPIADGQCSVCHAPHASNAVFLLAASDETELCARCHDWGKHQSHPAGPKVIDPRNRNLPVGCSSCHRTHGSDFAYLAHFDKKKDLCVQCHSTMAR